MTQSVMPKNVILIDFFQLVMRNISYIGRDARRRYWICIGETLEFTTVLTRGITEIEA